MKKVNKMKITVKVINANPSLAPLIKSGTLAQLIDFFKYVLDNGDFWSGALGREDINTKPQSGEELVLNLNKCVKNARRQESFYLV